MKKYKFRFTIIGNIIRTKGLDIAIEAFNKLNSQKAELHIYGQVFDKPYFDQCMSQVNRYLEVKHHGGYKPEELPGILSNSDIAIVPSRSESYSLTARECLQARVPVIVSAVGGLPEAVKDGVDGLYFKSEDANDLAEKMRFFLDEPSRVEDFRQRIQPVLSIEEDAERLEKIYQNLLGTENITGDEVKITGEEKLKTILEADNVVRFIEQHKNWLDDDLLTLVRKNAMTAHQDGNSELSEGLNNLGDYIKSLLQGKISG